MRFRWWYCTGGYSLSAMTVRAADEEWWQPSPGVNWDWRLEGSPRAASGVTMYDIDLFDVSAQEMQALRDSGIVVICYFSAGTYEEYRDDEGEFPRSALGNQIEGAEGEEWWININDEGIKGVMEARLDMAVVKGCDGVDPDGMEVFTYGSSVSGWDITAEEQLIYNKWIADQAHERNLSVGLKNDALQVDELEGWFDWALSTDCFAERTCSVYDTFISSGKAVLDAEFELADLTFCNHSLATSLDFIVKGYDLDERRCSCDFPETNVECDALLSANDPTIPPIESGEGDIDSIADDGGESEGTPTWIIITVIAMVVLMSMMFYAGITWRKKRRSGMATNGGVDDFL